MRRSCQAIKAELAVEPDDDRVIDRWNAVLWQVEWRSAALFTASLIPSPTHDDLFLTTNEAAAASMSQLVLGFYPAFEFQFGLPASQR